MKCISLWQPWASLLFSPGEFRKEFETRPLIKRGQNWYPSIQLKPGERVAIQAAKTTAGLDIATTEISREDRHLIAESLITETTEVPRFVGDGPCGAVFDDGLRRYRYSLWRRWRDDCEPSDMVAFIGLNPSTADESQDDPTIRRCIGFAKSWGFGGLVMLNLFAYRHTDPKVMKTERHPVGPWNDEAIRRVHEVSGRTVVCWGNDGTHRFRSVEVLKLVRLGAWHFGLTVKGEPKHPLYLPASAKLVRMSKGAAS